jgi:hypothetical protein
MFRHFRPCLLGLVIVVAACPKAEAKLIEECMSSATINVSDATVSLCPAGDFESLEGKGIVITVQVFDTNGIPIERINPQDIWLLNCDGTRSLFVYSNQVFADDFTDFEGRTTISTLSRGGLCVDGVSVAVMGQLIHDDDCTTVTCLPLKIHSVDVAGATDFWDDPIGDGVVDLADFSYFGTCQGLSPEDPGYTSSFNCEGLDFTAPETIDLSDFSFFGMHVGHTND